MDGASDLLAATSVDVEQATVASADQASPDDLRTAADALALLDSLIDDVLPAAEQAEDVHDTSLLDSPIADLERLINDQALGFEDAHLEPHVVLDETVPPQRQGLTESFAVEGTNDETADMTSRRELVILDPGVQNFESLRDLLSGQQEAAPRVELVVLDADRDGAQQIADILAGHHELDAVHILSHGTAQGLQLGSTWLDAQTIEDYTRRDPRVAECVQCERGPVVLCLRSGRQ